MVTADELRELFKESPPDVMFEITRWCNMACWHCMRGNRQRLRIKKGMIESTLSQFDNIGTIMFSGGEPSLAVDLIYHTLYVCERKGISVNNFWLATNGSVTSRAFFDSISSWLDYCCDSEVSGLRVSIDKYHDESMVKEWKFKEWNLEEDRIQIDYSGAPSDYRRLINTGRAEMSGIGGMKVEHELNLYRDMNGYLQFEGEIYINAKGNVITTCNISFAEEDDPKYIVCKVTDDIYEALARWFNSHPKQFKEER